MPSRGQRREQGGMLYVGGRGGVRAVARRTSVNRAEGGAEGGRMTNGSQRVELGGELVAASRASRENGGGIDGSSEGARQ